MNVKRDDTVLVIAGKDRGKKGRVREVRPTDNAIIVEGINIIKKHTRGTQGARQAGVIERDAPLNAATVMVAPPSCGPGLRIGYPPLTNPLQPLASKHSAPESQTTPTPQ